MKYSLHFDKLSAGFFDVQPDSAWETFFPLAASTDYNKRISFRHCEEGVAQRSNPLAVVEIASRREMPLAMTVNAAYHPLRRLT